MKIFFITFGLKYNHGEHLDFQIDTRILPNPFYVEGLKDKCGLDQEVYDYVINSSEGTDFIKRTIDYLEYYFEKISFHKEIRVGICCTGGQHRSVAVAKCLYDYFNSQYECELIHQDEKNWRRDDV